MRLVRSLVSTHPAGLNLAQSQSHSYAMNSSTLHVQNSVLAKGVVHPRNSGVIIRAADLVFPNVP
jgi:hypothetical protein